jgi:hypothetical protein
MDVNLSSHPSREKSVLSVVPKTGVVTNYLIFHFHGKIRPMKSEKVKMKNEKEEKWRRRAGDCLALPKNVSGNDNSNVADCSFPCSRNVAG